MNLGAPPLSPRAARLDDSVAPRAARLAGRALQGQEQPAAQGPVEAAHIDELSAGLHRALKLEASSPGEVRRSKPYYSDKAPHRSHGNLNSRAYFSGHEDEKGYEIVCRHLSMAWLLQVESVGKPDYREFESTEAIARHVPESIQDVLESLLMRSKDVQVVGQEDWSRFVHERFQAMERSGVPATRMLLQSGVHTMAAEFKLKRDEHGAPQYVVKVYDPNVTAAHKRIGSSDLAQVAAVNFKYFLKGERSFHRTFGKADESLGKKTESAMLVVGVPPGGLAELPGQQPGRRVSRELPPLDGSVMYHLVANGMDGTLREQKAAFLQLAASDPETAFDLLCARNHKDTHGLSSALVEDRSAGVAAFCDIVNTSALGSEMKAALLAGRTDEEHLPALCTGMTVGATVACKALIDGIVDSGLDDALRAELLASKAHGMPALAAVAYLGYSNVIQVFIDGVSRSGLATPVQVELLEARDAAGKTALAMALEAGNVDTVRALMQGIAKSGSLGPKSKQRLLAGNDGQGNPALLAAMQHDQPESVAAFVECVAKTDLPDEAKLELLLARQANGVSSLATAVENGWTDVARAFVEAVLQSDLPSHVKDAALRRS